MWEILLFAAVGAASFALIWLVLNIYFIAVLFAVCFALSFATYVVPFLLHAHVYSAQNLKSKYNASWAVVTGGSSGIGRAIVERLASQGINVVIAALDDPLLHSFHDSISKQYPSLSFRKVAVDLSKEQEATAAIAAATSDVDVQLLFNNAGYIQICFFADRSIESQMSNLSVNAITPVRLTHHFVNKMTAKGLKGCVVFTSSPAGQMPCPFSVVYGTSKAFITEFAASLAGEVGPQGIDVLAAHPSPVDTNFYAAPSASKSSSVAFFQKTAAPPTVIVEYMFRTVGRATSIVDQGYFCFVQKMVMKLLDSNFFASVLATFSHTISEYKTLMADRAKKN